MAARLTTLVVAGIVAATLIAGLIVGAQRDDSDGPVDLIVHHARVHTGAGEPTAEALAIRGNQILRVGSDRDVLRLRRPQTEVVDAEGGTVVPGFDDARVRFIDGAAAFDGVSLSDAFAGDDVDRRIKDWAEANPERSWVVGRGWRLAAFGDTAPTRLRLDRLVPDRPAQILSEDGQTLWVNSRALELAHLATGTGARRDRARGGKAQDVSSGLLTGERVAAVRKLLPAPPADERGRVLRAAVSEAHRYGLTSIHDTVDSPDDLAAYSDARKNSDLQLRVFAAVALTHEPTDAELDALDLVLERYPDDPLLKGGAVSLNVADFDADDLNRTVRRLDARGWQIIANTHGDHAVRLALDAFAHAARSNPGRMLPRRHRVDDAGVTAVADVPRFEVLGVVASVQPAREAVTDAAEWAAPAILREGGRLAFGSGWPLGPIDPLAGLLAAIEPAADGVVTSEPAPDRLTLDQAIDAYTAGGAFASLDEQRKGTLAPGMLADLVVLSNDILGDDADALAAARVSMTVFDGRIVYRRTAAGTN